MSKVESLVNVPAAATPGACGTGPPPGNSWAVRRYWATPGCNVSHSQQMQMSHWPLKKKVNTLVLHYNLYESVYANIYIIIIIMIYIFFFQYNNTVLTVVEVTVVLNILNIFFPDLCFDTAPSHWPGSYPFQLCSMTGGLQSNHKNISQTTEHSYIKVHD